MKCERCGFETQENVQFCPICGTAINAVPAENVSVNPVGDRVLMALKDRLFLTICILLSASSVLSLADGLPLLNILFSVFLWLTYAQSRKNIPDVQHLRSISGVMYAYYVIMNVVSIIFIVCGVIFGAALGTLAGSEEFLEVLEESFLEAGISAAELGIPLDALGAFGWMFGIAFVIAGVMLLVTNLLGTRKFHRLAKSVYISVDYCVFNIENARGAKNWLIFVGIVGVISAASTIANGDVIGTLAVGTDAAATLIASVLVNKYLVSTEQF